MMDIVGVLSDLSTQGVASKWFSKALEIVVNIFQCGFDPYLVYFISCRTAKQQNRNYRR
jgi:hypothetical protein